MAASAPQNSYSSDRLLSVVPKQEIEGLQPQLLHRPILLTSNLVEHIFGQRMHIDGDSLEGLSALDYGVGCGFFDRGTGLAPFDP
jgi:hypothetical protein